MTIATESNASEKTYWLSIPSLILGLLALFGAVGTDHWGQDEIVGLAMFFAASIILGVISLNVGGKGKGMAIAGIILSTLGLLIGIGKFGDQSEGAAYGIAWIVVIVSAIWVSIDARSTGVEKIGGMGPAAWFFVVLLFWIIGFPMYFYYRGKYKQAVAPTSLQSSSLTLKEPRVQIEQLEKLASLKEKGILTEEEFTNKKKELL